LDQLEAAFHADDREAWSRLERRSVRRREYRERESCYEPTTDCTVPGGCLVTLLESAEFEEHEDELRGDQWRSHVGFSFWAARLHRGEITAEGLPAALDAAREHYRGRERMRAEQPQQESSGATRVDEPKKEAT
jgi:hypothetical protein